MAHVSLRELLAQNKREKEAAAAAQAKPAAEPAKVLEAAKVVPTPEKAWPKSELQQTVEKAVGTTVSIRVKPNGTVFSRIQPKKPAVETKPPTVATTQEASHALSGNGKVMAGKSVDLVPEVKSPMQMPASPPSEPPKPGDEKVWEELRNNLKFLANNIEQKELVGQAVRNIAKQLQLNPQFESKMVRADFNLIVRGLRSAFVVAARKKVERAETKEVKSAEVNELMQMAKDMGISLS